MAHSVCILSCCAEKRQSKARAESLYCSESFFLGRRYAEANFDQWFVFSAQHGIVRPGDILEPYDLRLDGLSSRQRSALVNKVRAQIENFEAGRKRDYTSLCSDDYNNILELAGLRLNIPTFVDRGGTGKRSALAEETDPLRSECDLDAAYEIVDRLIRARGLRPLKQVIREDMPSSGVYIFFDPRESRLRRNDHLRIVRVGTHGVASGSKATLRDRMRTHFGTVAGLGNHRSSVFRLHIGRSMIRAGIAKDISSWGSSELPASMALRRREDELEAKVSDYIGQLLVALIDVPGDASKSNDRAYIEQNLIALLSNSFRPLDPPSHQWLGRNAERVEVRRSGIWNVNHTGQSYDRASLRLLDYYTSHSIGTSPLASKPIVPADWIMNARRDVRQLRFF